MRVIAGSLGGRQFASPRGHRTHPMSDKMRGGLFNTLGDISGLSVLDAFSGSGALSFEAISRGAKESIAIESDRLAQQAIGQNIGALRLKDQVKLIKASASAWLRTTSSHFDIVLLDPPYEDPQLGLLALLAERANPGSIIVVSIGRDIALNPGDSFQELSRKSYGDGTLTFYRRTS